ncbi:MAG: formate dehydrogenase accessory sulfurtransferase FdhD [Alphaproteobacteria bacterium]|nr:formate dehydrogenase accessory sulfurtransferase FdhD [Alphaproteobacteria bacterium]MCB9929734.1 formate dehydrogenase accessory sulfurtransferase FdhD [Alphaproteobacteria bacterium]
MRRCTPRIIASPKPRRNRAVATLRPSPAPVPAVPTHSPEVSPLVAGRLLTAVGARPAEWRVAEEVPLAVLVNGENFAVMMLTPADLEDFALGFALTEGLVRRAADVEAIALGEAAEGLVANLKIAPGLLSGVEARRRTLAGRSGCGVCGAQTIAAAVPKPRPVSGALPDFAALARAYAALPAAQAMNRANRTTHAAAWCALNGSVQALREDIGRHNALDKLAGALARDNRDAGAGFVLLSSRVSVEMVQKAAAIGAPALAAVSAPTALALRMAGRAGMTVYVRTPEGIMAFSPEPPR